MERVTGNSNVITPQEKRVPLRKGRRLEPNAPTPAVHTDAETRVPKQKSPREGAQFVKYLGPVLDALRKIGGSGSTDEVCEQIATDLRIADNILNESLPSGELRFKNQIAWARFYLVREGLLDSSKRGVWSLTEAGRHSSLSPEKSREIFLKWVKIFQEQRRNKTAVKDLVSEQTDPLREETSLNYKDEALGLLLAMSPAGFERLAQRLLRESGFIQVTVTGQSNDGGIDGYGTLQINPLVSFKVLFQCKRYKYSVTPSNVRDFRGAMAGRADKGIIITTGSFTAEARREAGRDGVPPIELIDGEKLIEMLETLELGLRPITTYEVDLSFFKEFV